MVPRVPRPAITSTAAVTSAPVGQLCFLTIAAKILSPIHLPGTRCAAVLARHVAFISGLVRMSLLIRALIAKNLSRRHRPSAHIPAAHVAYHVAVPVGTCAFSRTFWRTAGPFICRRLRVWPDSFERPRRDPATKIRHEFIERHNITTPSPELVRPAGCGRVVHESDSTLTSCHHESTLTSCHERTELTIFIRQTMTQAY